MINGRDGSGGDAPVFSRDNRGEAMGYQMKKKLQ
jgi:hypothetical protein